MTARKSDLRKYLDQTQALPDDVVLGWLVMFRITDANYDRARMEQLFDDLEMNPALLPSPNNPLHAYMKATSSVNDLDYALPGGDVAHVLVRDQHDDKEMVIRQLTREIRDRRARKLGYVKIGECAFYRPVLQNGKVQYGTERIRLTVDNAALAPEERPVLQGVIDKISESYDRHVNFMDAMKYRAVVREYLEYLNALRIKDGLYFVHSNRADELAKLNSLVTQLGGGSTMWMIPLVDLAQQRDMVVQAFQTEAEEALNDVIKQIAHVRGTRKSVTPEAYAKVKAQFDQAVNRANEYSRTLQLRGTFTSAAEELALESLAALQREFLEGTSA